MPSWAARATFSRVVEALREAVQGSLGVRQIRRAFALEVGDQHDTAGPGLRVERELGERVEVDPEQLGGRDQHARGVERRDQRQEEAGGVREPGDGSARRRGSVRR